MRGLLIVGLVALAVAATSTAQSPRIPPVYVDLNQHASDWNGLINDGLETHKIPGATLSVVYNGEVTLARGYGLADVRGEVPVDPRETLFRIGSITKVLVATAVANAEMGRMVDLDADINTYLTDFQVPATFPEPITLRHLLTHTAGFDDRFVGIGKRRPARLEPLGTYLARALPPRVEPPGRIFNYSNFGMVLAAHVVEVVSGNSFDHIAHGSIMAPIGARQIGFSQPLPDQYREALANSYSYRRGEWRPSRWRNAASQVWPAGAFAASATDMATIMLSNLGGGFIDGEPVRATGPTATIFARHFIQHPGLIRGQALAWHERWHNGHRILYHTGRVDGFTAQLVLAPDLRAGFFLAFNADSGDQLRNGAFDVFAKHFLALPGPGSPLPEVEAEPFRNLSPYAGSYIQSRRVRHGLEAVAFAGRETQFSVYHGGYLDQTSWAGAPIDRWRPIGRDVFEAVDSEEPRRLAFLRDEAGRITHAAFEPEAFTVLTTAERMRWWQTTSVQAAVGAVIALLLGSILFRARYAAYVAPLDSNLVFRLLVIASISYLGFVAVFALHLGTMDPYRIVFGVPVTLRAILLLPYLAAFCTLAASAVKAMRWKTNNQTAHWHDLTGIVACWAALLYLDAWGLL